MSQRWVPAVFMRGGTSKGLFFHAGDLPADPGERDRLLLAALGSPDPFGRQLDGMGGGISSLSKAAVIGPPTRPGADVDYTFAQVAVDRPVVDLGANCGNLSSAVGPFAVDQGLCPRPDGPALVRIHNTNTGRLLQASFSVRDGRAETRGELAIGGVAGTGAPVRLDFLDPGGARTGRLLPTGRPVDEVDLDGAGRFRLSLVDAANPAVFVAAAELGLDGTESPDELEARPEVMALLDRLRRRAGVLMGLAAAPGAVELASPKIAVLSPPRPFRTLDGRLVAAADHDVGVRMLSMQRAHRAVPVTGALCLGVACRVAGTVAQEVAATPATAGQPLRVGNPSGVVQVAAEVAGPAGGWRAASATLYRTARALMRGQVAVPAVSDGR
ncbi:MAG: PrpF family protein [Actinomycetia bacterium]|nr:PrpF family protein [Actinomycetes bacterium]